MLFLAGEQATIRGRDKAGTTPVGLWLSRVGDMDWNQIVDTLNVTLKERGLTRVDYAHPLWA